MNTSRRQFLKFSSGLTVGFAVGSLPGCGNGGPGLSPAGDNGFSPNAWVNIAADGIITIFSPVDELGQGSMTALPVIFAEELDADWDDVRIEMSPSDPEIYGNPGFFGLIYTAASTAVSGYYQQLRHFGAQTRHILLMNAAQKWQAPIAELITEPSVVVHNKTGRKLTYGEIAGFGKLPEAEPEITAADLKDPADFRLIGRSVPRRDIPDKVTGTSGYSINERLPGMLYATAVRAPVMNAGPATVDDAQARSVPGVGGVYSRERSVVIAADSTAAALKARRRLRVDWTPVGEVNNFDSETALGQHAEMARNLALEGEVWNRQGDTVAAFDTAGNIIERVYRTDYIYHAQLEPLNSVVWAKDNGSDVEAWVGTQAPVYTIKAIARETGVDESRVELHRAMLGGGFGRRSISEMDFVDDAAWLSKQTGRPVKLTWSREDDVIAGWFKPATGQFLRACLDSRGHVNGWHHRVAVQEPLTTAEPAIYESIDRRPVISMPGTDHLEYDFPNQLVEHLPVEPGIRTFSVMAVGFTPNKFAVESFIDEIAAEQGADALEFRLRHLQGSQRAQRVLDAAAGMAGWSRSRENDRELGIAFAEYHHTLIAGIAEISLEGDLIRVHDIWVAIDPGVAVQPDNIRAQVMGAVVYGVGSALTERITFRNGRVQQANFDDYPVPTMADSPRVHMEILPGGDEPSAVGQTGAVLVAPAIANAFERLTGKRLRHMPFTRERVREALRA
ncbi:MAG: molybdopterin-dependent oxidoreductase [Gammaproteobacteria bacterium]|nr:molybdopterin-dependent oxidoreductase [Gammaproteobacteria bacterium]